VIADVGFNSRLPGPPLNHAEGVGLHHAVRRAGRAARSAEQRPVWIVRDSRRTDVLIEEGFELVVARGLVFLAALLVEPDPSALPLGEIIPDGSSAARRRRGQSYKSWFRSRRGRAGRTQRIKCHR
jgi:hypothetical protein